MWDEPLRENAVIEIRNNIGQIVQIINVGIDATYQEINLVLQANGIYFVSLRGKSAFNSIKLVKIE